MRSRRLPLFAVAFASTLWLAACGGPSEADLLASAKSHLEKKEPKAAVIELKNALQKNPQSAEARYLLGTTLLDTGEVAAASVELRKAADLKYNDALVIPVLARALVLEGQERKVIESYGDTQLADAQATASLKTTLASAYARLDKPELAKQALAAALAAAPQHAPAQVMQARLAAAGQDFAAALATLDDVTARDPGNADAWLLKGEIQQRGSGDKAAALASYRKAVEARAELPAAHQSIVALLVDSGDLEGAKAHVEQLQQTQPNQPTTKLLMAQMAFLRKDYVATREIATPLLQLAPDNPLLLQLAGAAEYQLSDLPKAENLLAQALKIAPSLPLARQMLAQIYLRAGQPDKALDTLRPAVEAAQPRAETLALAGEAYLQTGDLKRAEEFFQRADKARPGDPRIGTALALSQLGKGNAAAGMAELEAISARDPGVTADLALISAHLRRKEIDQALKAIAALEAKQPDRPLAANLRGRTLMLRQDAAGARASFERALQLDPVYFPAVASLAALDMAEKKPADARKRFEDLLQADPKNARAQQALAALLQRSGAPASEVQARLDAAVKAAPTQAGPRLRLIDHLLARRDPKAALAAAQEAVAALPASPELLHALGRAQLANADYQQAVTAFNKLGAMQPKSPLAPMGLAEAYLGLKDYAGAEGSLKRAIDVAPDLLQAHQALIRLMLDDSRAPEALAVARSVQKRRPNESAGYALEGDIELRRKGWDAALAAYRTGLQKARNTESAVKLHNGLAVAGRPDEAEKFAASWQKDHPQDAAFRYYLGDAALARQDWALAEARYREVLRVQPGNPMALNNVAWLLVKQGKPGALAAAEKANQMLPDQPQLMDTLAIAMAAENKLPEALVLQKKTVDRAPEDPTLRLTLARLYLQAGNKAQAKAELETLAKLGKKFGDHAEVAELLKRV
jgi:putative PEP-CTERM system TPR-repeat lipoprotein